MSITGTFGNLICRTCLHSKAKDCREYKNIHSLIEVRQGETESAMCTIEDCLNYCLHPRLSAHMELSKYICLKCLKHLKQAYDFIKRARDSQDKFTSIKSYNEVFVDENPQIEFLSLEQTMDGYLDERTKDHIITERNMQIKKDDPLTDNGECKRSVDRTVRTRHCGLCEYNTPSTFNMKRHYAARHRDEQAPFQKPKIYECGFCNEVLKTGYLLHVHLLQHKASLETKMEIAAEQHCDAAEKNCSMLNDEDNVNSATATKKVDRSSNKHSMILEQCELCKYATNSEFTLKRHYMAKHKIQPSPSQLKNRRYIEMQILEEPEKSLRHRCEMCLKVFSSHSLLTLHLREHNNEAVKAIKMETVANDKGQKVQKYQCDLCSYGNHSAYNLSRHYIAIHKKIPKPEQYKTTVNNINYECKRCQKVFKTHSQLERHLAEHKEEAVEFVSTNNIEEETFESEEHEYDMKRKKKDGRKPSVALRQCVFCSFSTKLEFSLRRHYIKQHNTQSTSAKLPKKNQTQQNVETAKWKSLKCKMCAKLFATQRLLERHSKEHTGVLDEDVKLSEYISVKKGKKGLRKKILSSSKQQMRPLLQCEYCAYESRSGFNLKRHYAARHKQEQNSEQLKSSKLHNSHQPETPNSSVNNHSINEQTGIMDNDIKRIDPRDQSKLTRHCQLCYYKTYSGYNLKRHYICMHKQCPTKQQLQKVELK